jgi:hypothetical protein
LPEAFCALGLADGFKITTWTDQGLPTIGAAVNPPVRYEPPKHRG